VTKRDLPIQATCKQLCSLQATDSEVSSVITIMVQVSQRGGGKVSRSNNVRCIKQPAQDSASLSIGLVRLAILIGFARDS